MTLAERLDADDLPYRQIAEQAPDALLIFDADGVITFLNSAAEELFGHTKEELLGQRYAVLLPERFTAQQDAPSPTDDAEAGRSSQDGNVLELFGRHRDGSEFPMEVNLAALNDDAGARTVASVRDLRSRRQNNRDLREALSLVTATLESTADGILVVTAGGRIAGFNERFGVMWGIPAEILASGDDVRVMSYVLDQLADPAAFVAKVRELYADPGAESLDVLAFSDGRTFERYSRPQTVAEKIVGRVWSFRDITPKIQAEEETRRALAELALQADELKRLAFLDPLTGLPNRSMYREKADQRLAAGDLESVQVLLLDLDNFKAINDVLGHQAGDELLIEIGQRLKRCAGPEDLVARLGGDEFVVLLTRTADPGHTAECVLASVNAPVVLQGREVRPSLSLGVSGAEPGLHATDLLRRADIAMYAAKAAGKNCFRPFQPDMMTALLLRSDLDAGLRTAVERGEITVFFQPVMSAVQGRCTQVEALVRWQRPDGLVPPAAFIPAAESSGLINGIGQEVLRQTCEVLGPWLAENSERSVAVNISGVQMREPRFATAILDTLRESGVSARQLVLEVTESVFLDSAAHAIEQLTELRSHGVRVAIDDFGTGYSSLGRLQYLPVDVLKIDRAFVSVIETGDEQLPILESMIAMAHNLGLQVTAEGIETPVQASRLLRLGSNSLQGFYFARPVPLATLATAEQESAEHFSRLQVEVPATRGRHRLG